MLLLVKAIALFKLSIFTIDQHFLLNCWIGNVKTTGIILERTFTGKIALEDSIIGLQGKKH